MQQLEAIVLLEHQKLSIENPLLRQKIKSLEELNKLYIQSDSLYKIEIMKYKDKISSNENKIKKLKSCQKKIVAGSIVLFILILVL